MKAVEFGEKHGSCEEAMIWRQSLGPDATQADAYLACKRGDWLLWQLGKLSTCQKARLRVALTQAAVPTTSRAIRRVQKMLREGNVDWAIAWRRWARNWLSGKDRSSNGAWSIVDFLGLHRCYAVQRAACCAALAAQDATWLSTSRVPVADVKAVMGRAITVAEAVSEQTRKIEQRLQARDIRREIPAWPGE